MNGEDRARLAQIILAAEAIARDAKSIIRKHELLCDTRYLTTSRTHLKACHREMISAFAVPAPPEADGGAGAQAPSLSS